MFWYYHTDHLGSSNVMTDRAGNLARHYEYGAFGTSRYADATCTFNPSNRYTGQILDEDTGLYYYNARYYDPELGRFIQADTVVPSAGDPQSLNRYSYGLNNPLKLVDPSGHSPHGVGPSQNSSGMTGAELAAQTVSRYQHDFNSLLRWGGTLAYLSPDSQLAKALFTLKSIQRYVDRLQAAQAEGRGILAGTVTVGPLVEYAGISNTGEFTPSTNAYVSQEAPRSAVDAEEFWGLRNGTGDGGRFVDYYLDQLMEAPFSLTHIDNFLGRAEIDVGKYGQQRGWSWDFYGTMYSSPRIGNIAAGNATANAYGLFWGSVALVVAEFKTNEGHGFMGTVSAAYGSFRDNGIGMAYAVSQHPFRVGSVTLGGPTAAIINWWNYVPGH